MFYQSTNSDWEYVLLCNYLFACTNVRNINRICHVCLLAPTYWAIILMLFNSSPLVPHIYIYIYIYIYMGELDSTGSGNGVLPIRQTSHYRNQCWLIVNWTLRNKLQWNLNQNTKLFIRENSFENVCKMVAILSRGDEFRCVSYHTISLYMYIGKKTWHVLKKFIKIQKFVHIRTIYVLTYICTCTIQIYHH